MPQTISSVTCADSYTEAATIGPVYESNGGYFIITGQDVFMQLGYQQGGTRDYIWTPEVHVPLGNGVFYKGTVSARFRNYTSGSNATVSGALYYKTQPLFTIAAGGVATSPSGLNVEVNGTAVGTEPGLNLVDGSGLVISGADEPAQNRVTVTFYTPQYNVKAYGAIGNGVADDTTAIQAAITAAAAAGGANVWFPPGTYAISATLVCAKAVTLVGSGRGDDSSSANGSGNGTTTIKWISGSGANPMIQFKSATSGNALFGGGVCSMVLHGNHQATYCIVASSTKYQRFQDLALSRVTTAAILLDDNNGNVLSQECVFDNIQFTYGSLAAAQPAHGIQIKPLSGSQQATQHRIYSIAGLVYDGYLVYFGNTDNNHAEVVHAAVQSGGTGGAVIFKNADGAVGPARNNDLRYVNGSVKAESATYGNKILFWNDEAGTVTIDSGGQLEILRDINHSTGVASPGFSNAVAATTPGSVVKKIQVFDAAGASLGYLPVYSSIS